MSGAIDIVFDGPPGPEAGRFVEVESPPGRGFRFGEWLLRQDGYWVLRLYAPDTDDLAEAISDAVSDGEGRCYPDYLIQHLARRGMRIVSSDRPEGAP